jgi:hypothetical protein
MPKDSSAETESERQKYPASQWDIEYSKILRSMVPARTPSTHRFRNLLARRLAATPENSIESQIIWS